MSLTPEERATLDSLPPAARALLKTAVAHMVDTTTDGDPEHGHNAFSTPKVEDRNDRPHILCTICNTKLWLE